MSLTGEELITIALREAGARGYPDGLEATVTIEASQAHVLLSNPAYARGGGLLVSVDANTGAVVQAVRQL